MFWKLFVNLRKTWPRPKQVVLLNKALFRHVKTYNNFVYRVTECETRIHTSKKEVGDKGKDT
jgi:hypothetical protein